MGRPNKGASFINELETSIRKILDDAETKPSERVQAINAGIKLVELRRDVNDDHGDSFFPRKD